MLRIVGSVNSKSNAMVTGNLKSDPIQFERFKCFVLDAYREFAPKKTRKSTHQVNPEDLQDTKQSKATSRQRAQGINPYKLAQARIDDLSKLVELRGGKLTDGRHRFLYVFAICSTWFRGHVDDVAYDCEAFAHRCFADSSKYDRKRIGTILDRHQRDKDRVVVNTHNGERVPNRYRMRTDTIIRILGITPTEERYMATLIGSTERNRRREERRRAQGVKPRTEYLKAMASRTESTAERVSALAGKGMSASLIAEVIGLSKRRVNQIIAKANQCDMFS